MKYNNVYLLFLRGHGSGAGVPGDRCEDSTKAQQQYSEQSTLRIGESLPKSSTDQASLPSQKLGSKHRRRRHSGSIPDATTALSMMGGGGNVVGERIPSDVSGSGMGSGGHHHRHRSLSDSRSTNPRVSGAGGRGKRLETAYLYT